MSQLLKVELFDVAVDTGVLMVHGQVEWFAVTGIVRIPPLVMVYEVWAAVTWQAAVSPSCEMVNGFPATVREALRAAVSETVAEFEATWYTNRAVPSPDAVPDVNFSQRACVDAVQEQLEFVLMSIVSVPPRRRKRSGRSTDRSGGTGIHAGLADRQRPPMDQNVAIAGLAGVRRHLKRHVL